MILGSNQAILRNLGHRQIAILTGQVPVLNQTISDDPLTNCYYLADILMLTTKFSSICTIL